MLMLSTLGLLATWLAAALVATAVSGSLLLLLLMFADGWHAPRRLRWPDVHPRHTADAPRPVAAAAGLTWTRPTIPSHWVTGRSMQPATG